MEKKLPSSCKVVVIGGGVVGCSTAYHLAKFGWKDTILLERDQLTSGTTWHAAGLVSQLGPSAGITKIRKYSLDLYKKLEKEVDFSPGLKLNGALSIATTPGRWEELKRQATTAQLYDVNVEVLNLEQIKKKYPIINNDGVLGGIFMPGDGQADPVGVTNLLAKAAKKEGARIFEDMYRVYSGLFAAKEVKPQPGATNDGRIGGEGGQITRLMTTRMAEDIGDTNQAFEAMKNQNEVKIVNDPQRTKLSTLMFMLAVGNGGTPKSQGDAATNQSLPASYSSTSDIVNVDTFSLSTEAQGAYYGWVESGMILEGDQSPPPITLPARADAILTLESDIPAKNDLK